MLEKNEQITTGTNVMKMMKTIQLFAKEGVETGVLMGPIIPSINDHEIDDILRISAEHGASSASFTLARFNGDVSAIFADWLKRNYSDRALKVWNKVKSMHGGKVSDSRFGTRMKGEGNYAEMIRAVFHASRKKYFKEAQNSSLRKDLFRVNGNLNLFL